MSPAALQRAAVAQLLALSLAAAHAQPSSRTVRWTDVQLVDGRVLPAEALNGRTVVVQFWASWCPFCMKQNPHLEKLHRTHGGKGLTVLTFTLDRTDEAALGYMNKRGYTFAAARSTPEIEAMFGGRRTLPEVHVVDPQGRIAYTETGEMFEEDIAALARFATKQGSSGR
jgi:thiol-disulfide isomerase/thioredoxin